MTAPRRVPATRRACAARLAVAATLAVILSPTSAWAAALLDPSETVGPGRVRLDGVAVVTFSRDLRLEDVDRVVEASGRTFGIGGSVGLLEGFDGFLTLGASRLSVDSVDGLPGAEFDGDVGFAFGGGVRYRFVNEQYFKVGASVAITRHESSKGDIQATWLSGDLLLGASLHAVRDLVPFLGLAVGLADGKFDGPFGRAEFRQQDVIGAFAGIRYAATSQVQATLAGRLFDRTEVAAALSFGF